MIGVFHYSFTNLMFLRVNNETDGEVFRGEKGKPFLSSDNCENLPGPGES